jgi:hypothetical protein
LVADGDYVEVELDLQFINHNYLLNMKILITEQQKEFLIKDSIIRLLRRSIDINEIIQMVEYQSETQDPENFDDGDEFADFCITQGIEFYYEEFYDSNGEMKSDGIDDVFYEVEMVINELMYENLVEYYEEFK